MVGKISFLGATVAIIILVDIATGQGPPALNNYLAGPHQMGPPRNYPHQPTLMGPPGPMGYMAPRSEYELKDVSEKEFDKGKGKDKDAKESKEKSSGEKYKSSYEQDKGYDNKGYDNKGYDNKGYEKQYEKTKSTPAPGVLSSFSNSMSDAWKSFTSLGSRSRRSLPQVDN